MEAALSGAVRNLIVSVEAYPDLKSNTNFLELQRQLAETEDRIANGRRYYNANVRVYNTKVESVPTNIIANLFKFEKATYFEVNDPAVRQAPNVSFGEIAYRGDQQQCRSAAGAAAAAGSAPGYDNLPNPQQQYAPQPQQYAPARPSRSYQQPPQQTYARRPSSTRPHRSTTHRPAGAARRRRALRARAATAAAADRRRPGGGSTAAGFPAALSPLQTAALSPSSRASTVGRPPAAEAPQ